MALNDHIKTLASLLLSGSACVATYASADEAAAMAVLRAGCTEDAQRLCANVQPGGGRILACLKEHKDTLSDKCKLAAQQATSMSAAPSSDASSAPPPIAQAKPAAQASSSATAKRSAAASDAPGAYLRLKKVEISYAHVASLPEPQPGIEMLVPSSWDYKSAIQMFAGKGGCPSDSFSVFWEAKSEDGATKAQGIPNYSWQYSDDAQELQKLTNPNRRWHNGDGRSNDTCPVSKPLNAEQYLRQNVLNDLTPKMTLISIEPLPALEQIVRQQNGLPDAGNGGVRVEAIRARMEFQKDDKPMELWYSVALVTQTYRVGRGSLYDLHAVGQMAFGAPKGKLDANDKLFKVILSSIQPTAPYSAFAAKNIASEYQLQAKKEAAIDQIQADLENTITQTYLHMSANAQRVSDQGFRAVDQNVRDVQSFRDPSTGHTFELSNQYGHAWLNGANEYVMSNDPNFDPNSQLPGNWNQLQPVPP
jgi:hypothetical protein